MSDNAKSRRNKRSRNNRKKNKNKDGGQGSVSQDEVNEVPRIEIETPVQKTESSDVEKVALDSIECNGIKDNTNSTVINDVALTTDPEIKQVSSYENVTDIQITRLQNYTVQSPERTPERFDKKKLVQNPKSKSLDHDDSVVLDIIEVTELRSDDEKSIENAAIVSEAESDAEIIDKISEKNNIYEDVSIVTSSTPIKVLHENTAPITPEEEHDLRHFVRSLNLTTNSNDMLSKNLPTVPEVNTESDKDTDENDDDDDDLKKRRARKKAALEEHFLPQLLYPRFLDVIDEEGSSESVDAIGKRKRDSLKRYDDGDDDVFMPDKKVKEPKDFFPKNKNYSFCKSELKRQQECLLVGAKIVETVFEEGCGDWTIEKTEEKRGADIVYLDDSSSSTSEVELTDDGKDIPYADEDERVTIKTPIIEFDTNYHTSGNSVLLPILLNMQSNGNNKSSDNVCKLNGNSRLDSRRVTLTPPPSPETTLSSSDETVEGLESLPLHTPIPVACNEVIMLANDFVDELPVVTELLKNGETETKPEINKIILKESKRIDSTDTDYASSCEDHKDFSRQDSSGSVCSSHSTSHSTAKYNPSSSSLTDINALLHDDLVSVPEPVDRKIAGGGSNLSRNFSGTEEPNQNTEAPEKLKDLCVTKVASLPYGETILHELAAVSESLESLTNKLKPQGSVETQVKQQENIFSYSSESGMKKQHVMEIRSKPPTPTPERVPPPIAPRQSSFRLSREELPRIGLRSRVNPSVVALLTPSQKDQIERKWDTAQDEAGELIDMHKKYAERRGYREYHSDSELKTSSSNNIGDKVPVQSPMMRRRVSGSASYGAAVDANRPLASVRDREVVPNVTKNADDVRNPIPDRLRFAETLRSFEDLNENVLDGEKRTFFTKKIDGGNVSLDISETIRSDSRLSANIKGGNTDDTDFGLKSLEALIDGLGSKTPTLRSTPTQPLVNGNKESSTSKERIIKIYQNHSDSEDSKSHVQRLHNRRAFILDDPIFDTKKTNNTEMKKPMPFVDSGEPRRRRSLPRDIQDRQMEYIIQKEREIEEQIKSLEREKWFSNYDNLKTSEVKMDATNKTPEKPLFVSEQFRISKQGDVAIESKENGVKITKPLVFERPISQPPLLSEPSQGEKFRDKMYSEYMDRVAEREDRKHHKVIKMTSTNGTEAVIPSREGTLEEIKKACGMIEEEFITKAKQRWDKLGFGSFDDEIKNPSPKPGDPASESRPLIIDHKIKVLDGNEEKDVKKLPSHLREFVQFTAVGEGDIAGELTERKKDRAPSVFVTVCALLILLFTFGKSFWTGRE